MIRSGPLTPITRVSDLRGALDACRQDGLSVGFVPTMGYLHEGHASLIREADRHDDFVGVSIFVNPLQFAPTEDLAAYPRDLDRDTELAQKAGCDLLFVPDASEMYPEPVLTTVTVDEVSTGLEGSSRPSHFAGVATVVAKLFNIVGPCRAYFGEKDFQQLAVIRRMVRDLSFPIEVVGCPTVRELDGLAMSSRNAYLTPAERAAAPVVHRALQAGVACIGAGERDPGVVHELVAAIIEAEPLAKLDYVAVVESDSLTPVPAPLVGNLRLLAAVGFGRARLIDNVGVTV
ncbi:MAG TPA: pantoate--beta-alanine ligase [Acidimicrobiales bacterium]